MTHATATGAEERAGSSSTTEQRWPGYAPLSLADAPRLAGREADVTRIVKIFERPKSGQAALVWLHGPAGAGKTSLIEAGVRPALAADYGEGFHYVRVTPKGGDDPLSVIHAIADGILHESPEGGDLALDFEHRIRQFTLLHGQDPTEATEYLASCFKRSRRAGAKSERSICLIALDELEEFGPDGAALLPSKDEGWLKSRLQPVLNFLHDLLMTGLFPCVVSLRSVNTDAVKAGLTGLGHPSLGTWVSIKHPDLGEVRNFFQTAPADLMDTDHVSVEPMLLDALYEDVGNSPAGIPFVSETLRRLSEIDPAADSLSTADAGWAGGIAEKYAAAADLAVGDLPDHDAMGELMLALQKRVRSRGTTSDAVASKARYLDVIETSRETRDLVNRLINARVLSLTGTSGERAEIAWAIPEALREWDRAREWLEREDRRLETARRFDIKRGEWEKEERTPVLLEHACHALGDARKLIAHHERRPFLSDEVLDYLEVSLRIDEKLRGEIRKEKTQKMLLKYGVITAGAILLIFLIWFLFFR
ncbi:MAG: ATP-binding protein [Verrucomicrobiales bacterium]|nr:ATP-binding protein [Verrucomicrobiales bacterium]